MKALGKRTKGIVIGSVAGIAAVAVGAGIWQPWQGVDPGDRPEPSAQETVQLPAETGVLPAEEDEIQAAEELRGLEPWEMAALVGWFNQTENNGLLRFTYDDGRDAEQIAPFLYLLFYDISVGEVSEREQALLEETGEQMGSDVFRLPVEYMRDYLVEKLDMDGDRAELLLRDADVGLGVYLPETDTWFMFHGDTELQNYTFDEGVEFPDGRVVLRYSNGFVRTNQLDESGELVCLWDAPMELTLRPGDSGGWQVESNVVREPAEETLLYEEEFDLTEGANLTARLYGRKPAAETGSAEETSYGINRVTVLRGGEIIQTISIAAEDGAQTISGGYTECLDPNGWLETADLNGDGYGDLTLLEFLPAHNRPMLCWLWDKESGQFRYAGCILNPEPGKKPGEILSRSQDHAGAVQYIEIYKADKNGRFWLAKRVTEDYREDPTGKSPKVTEENFSAGEI